MRLGLKVWICAGGTVCALVLPRLAFAVTMGSLAPHDPPDNGQANEQWVTDLHTKCIAADPNYRPDDSISWQGQCRRDGVIYGTGTLTFFNGGHAIETITGAFNDGLLQRGHVTATWWSDGTKYDGGQIAGLFNGTGKFVSPKGNAFDGEWKMGVFQSGKAIVAWPNGDRYNGEWKNGKADGQGVEVWSDGRRFEGQFHDGAPVDDLRANANGSVSAGTGPAALAMAVGPAAQPPTPGASMLQTISAQPSGTVASGAPPAAVATAMIRTAAAPANGNATPNPALPLRSMLGTELAAIDGATLELGLTGSGFERTLVLPNGNSQEIEFSFANGPVGTVSDAGTAIGVFRATADEVDIDYADGTIETIGNGSAGLIDRAKGADGHTMCTAWYPQGHVFSQSEKQAALQEYASRLGLPVGGSAKKQHAQNASPACGGAFIASGNQQKTAGTPTQDTGAARAPAGPPPVPAQRAQAEAGAPQQRSATLENSAVTVPTPAVHLIDDPNAPARFESASFAPGQPLQAANGGAAAPAAPIPQPGASDCLTVASNGEYWGFQNHCTKSVQFAYCEMSEANPLTSCNHTSVAGSVAANGFSALVSDRSLAEKDATHEFRWMACDGGAGEVVPHLDKIDPPSGRCERAVASTP